MKTTRGVPLVRSKLAVPHIVGLLHRERVCEVIAQGLERKLTIVSAPAGYGKTAALVDFAQGCPVPVCWYTTDERDRDVEVFAAYLMGAIVEQFPDFDTKAQEGESARDPSQMAGSLVNAMLDVGEPFVVVIDNYESVDGALGVRSLVHCLLEDLPPNCHLTIDGRVLPEVPVTRLVARRQLAGLGASDLQFQEQEIRDVLALAQISVTSAQLERICGLSEGWITGVLLLADLMREDPGGGLPTDGGSGAGLYEYLASQVVGLQPAVVEGFLTRSSVLREMTPLLCRELLGVTDPQAMLSEIERRGLFVTRLGEGGGATYRYHNLFREFLEDRLRQREPTVHAELHLRAAKHYDETGDVEGAVYHFLGADVYSDAVTLMERVAREWFVRGRVEALLRWASALPKEVSSDAPRLFLYQSKVLTDRGDYAAARSALGRAEKGFSARDDVIELAKVRDQRGRLALIERRFDEAIAEAEAALEMLPEDATLECASALRLAGMAKVRLGQTEEGVVQLQRALALFRKAESPYDVVNLLQDLSHVLNSQGRLEESVKYLGEALAIAQRLGASVQLALVLNNLGWVHHMRGQYEDALDSYEKGLAIARRSQQLSPQAELTVGLGDVYRDVGAADLATLRYNEGWEWAQEHDIGLALYVLVAQADMYRRQGNASQALVLLARARRVAEECRAGGEELGLVGMAEGSAKVEKGDIAGGLAMLDEAVAVLQRENALLEEGRARFLLAKAHLLAGQQESAVEALGEALRLAQDTGVWQLLAVEGKYAPELVSLATVSGLAGSKVLAERVEALESLDYLELGDHATREDVVHLLMVYGLGEGRVVCDGHTVTASEWRSAMARELFFYLLLEGPATRDEIWREFWPGVERGKMVSSFHTTLSRIRRALGKRTVVAEDGVYKVGDISVWLDVIEFEMLVDRGRQLRDDWQAEDSWRRAAAMYRGDLLPQVERAWCCERREGLREKWVEALVGLGRCCEARNDPVEAEGWYLRALEVDDLREDVHRRLMGCRLATGQRAKAMEQYRDMVEMLERELGVGPSAETVAVYQNMLGETEAAA